MTRFLRKTLPLGFAAAVLVAGAFLALGGGIDSHGLRWDAPSFVNGPPAHPTGLGWSDSFVQPVSAQTLLTNTTLSTAQGAFDTTLQVNSNTGFTVGNYAYIDFEAELIVNVSNGTAIGVQRGQLGTRATAHAIAVGTQGATGTGIILTGPPGAFIAADPFGSCTRGGQSFLPVINVTDGVVWSCDVNARWIGTNVQVLTLNSIQLR